MPDNDDDYKVGPGRPPKEHRWRKGQPSPNPRGRPIKKDLEKMFAALDPFAEMVDRLNSREIMSAGGAVQIREANYRLMMEMAHSPKTPAKVRADMLKTLSAIDKEAQAVLDRAKEKQFNAALDHKERWDPAFRQAAMMGQKPPAILPHPDDVIIAQDGRVAIVGPKTPQEQKYLEFQLSQRRVLTDLFEQIRADKLHVDRMSLLRSFRRRLSAINKEVPPRLHAPVPRMPADLKT